MLVSNNAICWRSTIERMCSIMVMHSPLAVESIDKRKTARFDSCHMHLFSLNITPVPFT